jgi:hypothetical protein
MARSRGRFAGKPQRPVSRIKKAPTRIGARRFRFVRGAQAARLRRRKASPTRPRAPTPNTCQGGGLGNCLGRRKREPHGPGRNGHGRRYTSTAGLFGRRSEVKSLDDLRRLHQGLAAALSR